MQTNFIKALGLVFSIALLAQSQVAHTPELNRQEILGNPTLLQAVNNFYGCRVWEDSVCVECAVRYVFNEEGICCLVDPQCRTFNSRVGLCESCYNGFQQIDGRCVLEDLATGINRGCRRFDGTNCLECSFRFFRNAAGVCEQVSDLCATWAEDGACMTCFGGFGISGRECIIVDPFTPSVTDLCREFQGRTCIRCAERAFFDSNGICREVNTNCQTFDPFDGQCLSCFRGFNLLNGGCEVAPLEGPSDIGCAIFDLATDRCTECSFRFFFGANGLCQQVDDFCNGFDFVTGACTTCFRGFELENGACTRSELEPPSDLGCARFDIASGLCT